MPENTDFAQFMESMEWLGGFLLLAILVRILWTWLVSRRLKDNEAGQIIAGAVQGLFISALVLVGIARATFTVDYIEEHPRIATFIGQGLSIAWIILFAVLGVRSVNATFALQELSAEHDPTKANLQDLRTRHGLYRKILITVIGGIACVYALRIFGADLTPLLAGGTVGGIVLGLALQESLANFFAGIFLNMDRPASVGDLVRLENGHEGFVEEIGWRSTRIRLWSDAKLVIPNSKFSSSWLINFHQSAEDVWVSLDCSIEYGSDLQKAEDVAIRAGLEAMAAVGLESETKPYVRWREFADSGIVLRIFLPASEAATQYRMKSECVKAVDRLFRANGIEFAYPVRRMIAPVSSA